ncbi:hypothetical protein K3495_g3733 [Podosphaera aphanis]|nr:hypothetical protein K3495_g3733 [Podosphaera aphanis]
MSTPTPRVPPRPSKVPVQTLDKNKSSPKSSGLEVPRIPPRPVRKSERSVSPPESYAQSPLNISPGDHGSRGLSPLDDSESINASEVDICRPSSVNLPSLGQEGIEYADAYQKQEEDPRKSPPQVRNIDKDLKLHAPKPSLSDLNAMESVLAVTRTDSSQAAAYGLGKANDHYDFTSRSVYSTGSEVCPSSVSSEHGIPQIGQTVPMYPNAGDVQAPSPALSTAASVAGTSVNNDGIRPRHHGRKPSGRDHDVPPDTYGRYGHGMVAQDRFDKAYYKKHPELFKKELGSYGDIKPEWALNSDDLNKIVRETASHGTGVGVSSENFAAPSEQVGFRASEEYASRMSSPRPPRSHHLTNLNVPEAQTDSCLKNESNLRVTASPSNNSDDAEIENIIHVDNPRKHATNIRHNSGYGTSKEALSSSIDREAINDDHGYGAPILASDEVAKEPYGRELEPAVSPLNENAFNFDESPKIPTTAEDSNLDETEASSISASLSKTPLEDVIEYEPLFPDEEKEHTKENEIMDSLKIERLESKNRKFPSRDVWEDTPHSLQYTATVSTPQLPEEEKEDNKIEQNIETPAQAFARRHEELAEQELTGAEIDFQGKTKKNRIVKHENLIPVTKPKLSNSRFPSRDIWEDAPDSLLLQTTVAGPQVDKEALNSSERPEPSKLINEQSIEAQNVLFGDDGSHDGAASSPVVRPSIPARPITSNSNSQEQPEIIGSKKCIISHSSMTDDASSVSSVKPKPQVPVRPSKNISREPSETSSSHITSSSVSTAKTKPLVPSRPTGNKIAALQAGFMSDLSKRLQLGPQAPKKEAPTETSENENERAPLADPRKARARGPARRAPGKSQPAPSSTTTSEGAVARNNQSLEFSAAFNIWSIGPNADNLHVYVHEMTESHSMEREKTPVLGEDTRLHNSNHSFEDVEEEIKSNSQSLDQGNQEVLEP